MVAMSPSALRWSATSVGIVIALTIVAPVVRSGSQSHGSDRRTEVAGSPYPWLLQSPVADTLAARIATPSDFLRVPAEPRSFTAWLRGLPLKPGRPDVRLFNGRLKANQTAQFAVIEIDVGPRDLQ